MHGTRSGKITLIILIVVKILNYKPFRSISMISLYTTERAETSGMRLKIMYLRSTSFMCLVGCIVS